MFLWIKVWEGQKPTIYCHKIKFHLKILFLLSCWWDRVISSNLFGIILFERLRSFLGRINRGIYLNVFGNPGNLEIEIFMNFWISYLWTLECHTVIKSVQDLWTSCKTLWVVFFNFSKLLHHPTIDCVAQKPSNRKNLVNVSSILATINLIFFLIIQKK